VINGYIDLLLIITVVVRNPISKPSTRVRIDIKNVFGVPELVFVSSPTLPLIEIRRYNSYTFGSAVGRY
jgi:hypothetical protein